MAGRADGRAAERAAYEIVHARDRSTYQLPQEGIVKVIVTSAYKSPQRLHAPGEVLDLDAQAAVQLFERGLARPLVSEPEQAVRPLDEVRTVPEIKAALDKAGIEYPARARKAELEALLEGR